LGCAEKCGNGYVVTSKKINIFGGVALQISEIMKYGMSSRCLQREK
jgi:hypothetical protein